MVSFFLIKDSSLRCVRVQVRLASVLLQDESAFVESMDWLSSKWNRYLRLRLSTNE